MSLDLSSEGFSFSTSAISDISTINASTFNGGDNNINSSKLQLQIDTSSETNPVDLSNLPNPTTLGVISGCTLTIVKINSGGTNLTYTDPLTTITYNYVDRQGESITLQADIDGDRWIVTP